MPFLLAVALIALYKAISANFHVLAFLFVGANPSGITANVRETDRVSVKEGSLAPAAILDHLLGVLVIKF